MPETKRGRAVSALFDDQGNRFYLRAFNGSEEKHFLLEAHSWVSAMEEANSMKPHLTTSYGFWEYLVIAV